MFTKKMASDNRAIQNTASDLISEVWNYETEFSLPSLETGLYIKNVIKTVSEQIKPMFPDISSKRIERQVNVVLMRKRGYEVRKRNKR